MVQIEQDENILRDDSYKHINDLMKPEFYLMRFGTCANIYNNHRYVGFLFLDWHSTQITIYGYSHIFLDISNKIEEHGYSVIIKCPEASGRPRINYGKPKKLKSSNIYDKEQTEIYQISNKYVEKCEREIEKRRIEQRRFREITSKEYTQEAKIKSEQSILQKIKILFGKV